MSTSQKQDMREKCSLLTSGMTRGGLHEEPQHQLPIGHVVIHAVPQARRSTHVLLTIVPCPSVLHDSIFRLFTVECRDDPRASCRIFLKSLPGIDPRLLDRDDPTNKRSTQGIVEVVRSLLECSPFGHLSSAEGPECQAIPAARNGADYKSDSCAIVFTREGFSCNISIELLEESLVGGREGFELLGLLAVRTKSARIVVTRINTVEGYLRFRVLSLDTAIDRISINVRARR